MQFVVIAEHSPDLCPISNSKIREMLKQGSREIPNVAAKLGVKIVTLNVLGPEHRAIAVVEADNVETVRNFALESRLVQWNTVNIHAAWTLEEALANADKVSPIF